MSIWCLQQQRWAFTLIELLIVVAIIAILATIAVPNFLEAQNRTKLSRAMNDQRAAATALETYCVDYNKYPVYGNPKDASIVAGEPIVFLPVSITTPVAYLSALPPDIYTSVRTGISYDRQNPFFYMHNYETIYLGKYQPQGHVEDHFFSLTGERRPVRWTMWSYGPDLKDNHGTVFYDSTNGTLSRGDLMKFGP